MENKKLVEFHISYKPELFSFSCDVLMDDFEIQRFHGFQHLAGLMERINPICGILHFCETEYKIIPADNIADIYNAYKSYTDTEYEITEPLFEGMPDKRRKLVDKIWSN